MIALTEIKKRFDIYSTFNRKVAGQRRIMSGIGAKMMVTSWDTSVKSYWTLIVWWLVGTAGTPKRPRFETIVMSRTKEMRWYFPHTEAGRAEARAELARVSVFIERYSSENNVPGGIVGDTIQRLMPI